LCANREPLGRIERQYAKLAVILPLPRERVSTSGIP